MIALFHDTIHKEMEVYIDNMIAQSKTEEDYLVDLKIILMDKEVWP